MIKVFVVLLIIWNIIVFILYGADKFRAIHNFNRISEKTLISSALLFGGIGALAGMEIFRHKTKHMKFKVILPIAFAITVLVLMYLITSK